jgi:hypothetical protein
MADMRVETNAIAAVIDRHADRISGRRGSDVDDGCIISCESRDRNHGHGVISWIGVAEATAIKVRKNMRDKKSRAYFS